MSAKEIVGVKQLIDKKAWPYVQNDLRLRASYLRYDLNTVISAKPGGEKKPLKDLTGKLFSVIDNVSSKVLTLPSIDVNYMLSSLAYSFVFSFFLINSWTMQQKLRAPQKQRSTTPRLSLP